MALAFLISGFAFVFLILVLLLDWVNNRLILTNLRLTRQRGIIGKTIMTTQLDRIQDVKVCFGIFGRIFGFGTLEIESAGTYGKMLFRGIPSPKKIKQLVDKEVESMGRTRYDSQFFRH